MKKALQAILTLTVALAGISPGICYSQWLDLSTYADPDCAQRFVVSRTVSDTVITVTANVDRVTNIRFTNGTRADPQTLEVDVNIPFVAFLDQAGAFQSDYQFDIFQSHISAGNLPASLRFNAQIGTFGDTGQVGILGFGMDHYNRMNGDGPGVWNSYAVSGNGAVKIQQNCATKAKKLPEPLPINIGSIR